MSNNKVLVTGGAGFLGQYLVKKLVDSGKEVSVLDVLYPEISGHRFLHGDIRDPEICLRATEGVSTVFHNVAQVPLAKNYELFKSVNILGTRNILEGSALNNVDNFIFTSSSAVFGLPSNMPANSVLTPFPVEEYGRTKLKGEQLVNQYKDKIENTSIVRPRTILGSGRLGLFSILFDWISEGLDVFVFDEGENSYQFIHALDLADGIIAAGNVPGHNSFNLGATEYNSLRTDLEVLCRYADTGSRVRSIPSALFRKPLLLGAKLNLIPFASYQLLLYSKAMYFDSENDWSNLNVTPKYSNSSALIESYEWFLQNKGELHSDNNQSVHRSIAKGASLSLMRNFLKLL
jgi:nucleoside-diphosphate-sugar epimerase